MTSEELATYLPREGVWGQILCTMITGMVSVLRPGLSADVRNPCAACNTPQASVKWSQRVCNCSCTHTHTCIVCLRATNPARIRMQSEAKVQSTPAAL